MNARQAAKAAAQRIEELENYNRRCSADIKAYNQCIDAMIVGESPCQWCMEHDECQLEAKDGKGCSEWWLKDIPFEDEPVMGGDADVGNEDKGNPERVQIHGNVAT